MLKSKSIRRVAVTGCLSAGKSSVCRFFAECGAYVVSSDQIVHHLLDTPSKLTQQIIELLGDEVVIENRLDRRLIAKRIFTDKTLATAFEQLLHPHVHHAIGVAYQTCLQAATYPLFVAEIPLLYEVGWDQDFDDVVAVIANIDICRERFKRSFFFSTSTEADLAFMQRMARQLDPKEKARRADYVLTNETTDQNLQRAVQELYETLTQSS